MVYDLVERVGVAERWSSREVVLFGAPDAERHLADGFYREGGPAGSAGFVWARQECELSFSWLQRHERTSVVEMMPYQGVRGQSVSIFLNATSVESLRLNDGRHRYRIKLPAAAQVPGENRLRFVFASAASPADSGGDATDRRHLAAAFYTLVAGPADDPGVDELLRRGAPAPFAVAVKGGVPALTLIGPSVVRYAIRVPARGELRFTPELHPAARAAGQAASFRVTMEERPGKEREVWSKVIGPTDKPHEIRVPLALKAGSLVRLGLHVGNATTARAPWGTWIAARVLGTASGTGSTAARKPELERLRASLAGASVLLIVLDAARASSFGAYGYDRGTTPNIDRIATEGVVFERAFTPAVYTLAAMSSLWTSQHPDRHHAAVSFSAQLPKDRLTLADVLSAQGIQTAGFVANQVAGSFNGFDRGFAEFHDVWRERGSGARSLVDAVEPWLAANRARRFFAYVHFREPHAPYDPPPPFDARFAPAGPIPRGERAGNNLDARLKQLNHAARQPLAGEIEQIRGLYDGNLAFADEQVGRLRRAMELAGLWNDTTVIVTADHGEALFEHGWIGHNTQVYEESSRVPLVVRLARGAGPAGQRLDPLVDLGDIAPTIADQFGVLGKGGSDREFTGRSLLRVMAGESGHDFVLSRTVWDRPVYALRDERFKAILDTRTGVLRVFDLRADPGETLDVAAADTIRAAFYRQTLENMVSRLAPARVAEESRKLTAEQCESLKALGYVGADVKCE